MNTTDKEDMLLRHRLSDLAHMAWSRNCPVFTGFLGLNEQNIYHSCKSELSFIRSFLYGGYEEAERQMVGFLPDAFCYAGNYESFPIACVRIVSDGKGFSQPPGHRDYLGALLNLGIDRSTTGDILLCDGYALLMCEEKMARFVTENLFRVRNMPVSCSVTDLHSVSYYPKTQQITGSIASVRIDSLIALAFKVSRSAANDLLDGGKVFINGKLCDGNGTHIRDNDLISVRGCGRFRFSGILSETKKGRVFVAIEKYI